MAGLESSERSPTHMSAVRHPHPRVPSHVVSPALWPQSSEASDPGERELGRICIDFSDLVLELTQLTSFLCLSTPQGSPTPVAKT